MCDPVLCIGHSQYLPLALGDLVQHFMPVSLLSTALYREESHGRRSRAIESVIVLTALRRRYCRKESSIWD
jgi:hypothetical protein